MNVTYKRWPILYGEGTGLGEEVSTSWLGNKATAKKGYGIPTDIDTDS